MAMRRPAQLPLSLSHPAEYGRDSFVAGASNAAALRAIESWPDWASPVAVLTGPPGSGKTHLAHIWANRSGARLLASEAIDADTVPSLAPGEALVVEDIAAGAVPERALFHLINAAKELGASLLLTSRRRVGDWQIGLPDLRSRLRMATPLVLEAPDEEFLRKVLVKLFADRQLMVDRAVLDYLLLRMERSLDAAPALVEALDREALASGRSITRTIAARVLSGTAVEAPKFTELE
jgi:chromosomal replication initiation ATPase DnaA